MAIARKSFVRMQLEGEKLTQFFCKINRKFQAKAQFEEIHLEEVDDRGKEMTRIIRDQETIEMEVRQFYCNLYSEGETNIDKEEILRNIEALTKIYEEDAKRLDTKIRRRKCLVL